MQTLGEKVEVKVEEVKQSSPNAGRDGVVIETEARVDGALRDASIEVLEADAPTVAVALLNAEIDVGRPLGPHDLPPPVQCLAAGVVYGEADGSVRLHLQFESGQVLPVEMPRSAASALMQGLELHLGPGLIPPGRKPQNRK